MFRAGGVIALVALVALAGCTGLSGIGGETGTPETTPTDESVETPTPTPTPEATQTPESTPEPTPSSTPTPGWDEADVSSGVDSPTGVELRTYANNESRTLLEATVTVSAGNGTELQSFSDDSEWQHAIEDLEPGTNYTVVVSDIGWQDMPPVETSFDPGQTDEVDVFTLPDFQQADTFEWDWRFIQGAYVDNDTLEFIHQEDFVDRERQLVGGGVYDNGDWVLRTNAYWVAKDPDRNETIGFSIDGSIYTRDFHKNWREIDEISRDPTHQPSFAPVRKGIFDMDNVSLDYLATRELNDSTVPEALRVRSIPAENNGTEVHVFAIEYWGYSERAGGSYYFDNDSQARIYVDTETGDVLRWEARERLSVGVGGYDYYRGMNPSIHVIDFYNHGDEDLDVDPEDYPPTR